MSSTTQARDLDASDNDYVSRTAGEEVPVQSDDKAIDDPVNEATADSDEQLVKDDSDAIDESNIIDERTRGAAKDSYTEPGDEEGLPGPEDGTSQGRQ